MSTSPNRSFVFDIKVTGSAEATRAANDFIVPLEKLDKLATQLTANLATLSAALTNFGKVAIPQSGIATLAQQTKAATAAIQQQTAALNAQAAATKRGGDALQNKLRNQRIVNAALSESIRLGESSTQANDRIRVARATAYNQGLGGLVRETNQLRGQLRGGGGGAPPGFFGSGTAGWLARSAGRALVSGIAFGGVYGAYRGARNFGSSYLERIEQERQADLGAGSTILTAGRYYGGDGQQLPIGQQFALARAQGKRVRSALLRDSIKTGLSYEGLQQSYTATAGFLNAATQDPEKQAKILEGIIGISDRLGVSQGQVSKTLDNIIKGVRVQNTELGSSLGLTSDQVKEWRKAGVLVEKLTEHLAGAAEANKENLKTTTGIKNAIESQLTALAQQTGGGFYDTLLSAGNEFLAQLGEIEKSPAKLEGLRSAALSVAEAFRSVSNFVGEAINKIAQMGALGDVGKTAGTYGYSALLGYAAKGVPGAGGAMIIANQLEGTRQGMNAYMAGDISFGEFALSNKEEIQALIRKRWLERETEAASQSIARRVHEGDAGFMNANDLMSPFVDAEVSVEPTSTFIPTPESSTDGGKKRKKRRPRLLDAHVKAWLNRSVIEAEMAKDRAEFMRSDFDARALYASTVGAEGSIWARRALSSANRRGASVMTLRELESRRFGIEQGRLGDMIGIAEDRNAWAQDNGTAKDRADAIEDLNRLNLQLAESTADFQDALEELNQTFGTLESHARNLGGGLVSAFFGGGNFRSVAKNWAGGVLQGQAQQGVSRLFDSAFGMTGGMQSMFGGGGASVLGPGAAAGTSGASLGGASMMGGGAGAFNASGQLVATGSQSAIGASTAGSGTGAAAGAGGAAAAGAAAALIMIIEGSIAAGKLIHDLRNQGGYSQQKINEKASDEAFRSVGLPSFLSYIAGAQNPAVGTLLKLTGVGKPKTEGAYTRKGLAKLLDQLGIPRVGPTVRGFTSPTIDLPGISGVSLDKDGLTSGPDGHLIWTYSSDFTRSLSFRDFGAFKPLENLSSLSGRLLTTDPRTGKAVNMGSGAPPPVEDVGRASLTNLALLGVGAEDARSMMSDINQAAAGGSFASGARHLLAARARQLQDLAMGKQVVRRSRPGTGRGVDDPTFDTNITRADIDKSFGMDVVSLLDSFTSLAGGIDASRLALEAFAADGTVGLKHLERAAEDATNVFTGGIGTALDRAIQGTDFTAPGTAIADSLFSTFTARLSERMLQEGALGKFITDASAEATLAAEALAAGDRAGFAMHSQKAAEIMARGSSLANETIGAIGASARGFGGSLGLNVGGGVIVGTPIASVPSIGAAAGAGGLSAGGYMPSGGGQVVVSSDPALIEYSRQQTALLAALVRNGSTPTTIRIGNREFQVAVSEAISSSERQQSTGSNRPNANLGA